MFNFRNKKPYHTRPEKIEIKAKILTKKLIDENDYKDFIIAEILLKKTEENLFDIGEIIYINKDIEKENNTRPLQTENNPENFFKDLELIADKKSIEIEEKTKEKKEPEFETEYTKKLMEQIEKLEAKNKKLSKKKKRRKYTKKDKKFWNIVEKKEGNKDEK